MSEEFESSIDSNYSAFWPLLVLLVGLLLWMGYQDWAENSQRIVYDNQFRAAAPSIEEADKVKKKYIALMQDLIETAKKDQPAADIEKAAISAGLIQVQQKDTNAAAGTAPAADGTDAAK